MHTPSAFLIIRASAGSGKTFRLVQEYLMCCLGATEPDYFRRILAITFTRNAAMEMRERILSGIDEVAQGEGDLYAKIAAAMDLEPALIQQRAAAIRRTMLHRYEDFSVMTIDSFVSRLVRSFARELALEEDFRVELSLEDLVGGAVGRLLEKVGKEGEEALTHLMESFAKRLLEEEKDVRVKKQLADFGRLLGDERTVADLAQLDREDADGNRIFTPEYFTELHGILQKRNRGRDAEMQALAEAALAAMAAQGLGDKDWAYGALPSWLKKLTAKGSGFNADPGVRVIQQFASGDFGTKKTAAAVRSAMDAAMPAIEAAWAHYQEAYTGPLGAVNRLLIKLEDKVFYIGALVLLRQELRALEEEEHVRLLQTLNGHISQIVQSNPTPFIFERLGVKYNHLFIDEFQDTSVTQWHNLVPLVADLIADRHRCLVVGDAKQAIYRWRNGDYRQLEQLPKLVGDRLPATLRQHESKLAEEQWCDPLQTNHRSRRHIIAWNNALFEAVMVDLRPDLAQVYANGSQFAFTEEPGEVHIESVRVNPVGDFEAASIEWVLRRLVHHIGGKVETSEGEDGTVHYRYHEDGGLPRRRQPGDCAVLVRTNSQGASIARALLAANIKTFTDDSLQLGRHPVPRGVVALLRSILEPQHFGHGVGFLQCYCALSGADEAELVERHRVEVPYTDAEGKSKERVLFDLDGLLESICPELDLPAWTTEPLVGLIGHIIASFGWDRGHQAYVEGLLELAQQGKTAEETGIPGFLESWDRKGHKQSIRSAEQPDAVRIKTIHKAKGQAFPVVLMPIAPKRRPSPNAHLPVELDEAVFGLPLALFKPTELKGTPYDAIRLDEMHKEVLDELNVLYVGMTRPKHAMELLFGLKDKDAKAPEEGEPWSVTELLERGVERAFQRSLAAEEAWTYEPAPGAVELDPEYAPRVPRAAGAEEAVKAVQLDRLVLGVPMKALVVEPPRDWWAGGGLSARQRGDALHSVLGQIRTQADLPPLLDRIRRSLAWSDADRDWLETTLDRLFASAALAPLFAEGVDAQIERSFWLPSGEIGRPDRVVRTPDGWAVLDYKSGKPAKKHHEQVRAYMAAVAEDTDLPVRGLLFYTESGELVEVVR